MNAKEKRVASLLAKHRGKMMSIEFEKANGDIRKIIVNTRCKPNRQAEYKRGPLKNNSKDNILKAQDHQMRSNGACPDLAWRSVPLNKVKTVKVNGSVVRF